MKSKRTRFIGETQRGALAVSGISLHSATFETSALSMGTEGWAHFKDCEFEDFRIRKCVVGFPVFESCTFRNITVTDVLGCQGALFINCKLEGTITGINFALRPKDVPIVKPGGRYDEDGDYAEILRRNELLFKTASYCLDVRRAVLNNVGFRGEEIIPWVVFEKGQCAIYEGQNLEGKLRRVGLAGC